MRTLIKGGILLLVVTGIQGCMLDISRRTEYTVNHTTYQVETYSDSSQVTEVSPAPSQPPSPPQVVIKTLPAAPVAPPRTPDAQPHTCKLFALPTALAQPLPPNLENPGLKQADIDVLMSDYIKALRGYIERDRSSLEQTHKQWLESCNR